jgi:hypothetical protein
MHRLRLLAISAACLSAASLTAVSGAAQQKTLKEQLVGDWVQVSNVTTRPDGSKVETWGANPKSLTIFESNGRMALVTVRSDLPKFASGNRMNGTADEYKAVVQGSIAYFGTYSVDEAQKELALHIEGASFPNWAGTTQKRKIEVGGDELTQHVTAGSGGGTVEIKFKRLK